MDMPNTDITDPMQGPAVKADPMRDARAKAARMKKINPKGRKLDKNGNPIVTKEELEKSGKSLRDFLNEERGLTKRVTTSDRIKNDETRKRNTAPVTRAETDARVMADEKRKRDSAPISQAMDKSVGRKDDDRRDKLGNFAGESVAKSLAAEGGAGAAALGEAREADKLATSKYTSGMKAGGSTGMHRMPDGKMMKDSEHKKPKKMMGGGMMKYAHGGSVGKGYGKARGAKACKMR
jgi:hypothetical protein